MRGSLPAPHDLQHHRHAACPSPRNHNSARSQLAEAIARHLGGATLAVQSAGIEPAQVHPLALAVLADTGIDSSGLVAKHVDTLADQTFDYVITVCDRAREACPTFPGHPEMLHWSFPDPSAVPGSELARRQAFETTAQQLMTRIRFLITILDRAQRDRMRERTDV
jgi:ArsR family transcriptional regulator, arsenate/arsenite/antimonite-responsive transcriptional repressor / arsenate reductase (thioredoxin)